MNPPWFLVGLNGIGGGTLPRAAGTARGTDLGGRAFRFNGRRPARDARDQSTCLILAFRAAARFAIRSYITATPSIADSASALRISPALARASSARSRQ
jgi:hypothetical protein